MNFILNTTLLELFQNPIETDKIDTSNKYIHDRLLSWLCTIKSGDVKFLWPKPSLFVFNGPSDQKTYMF